MRIPAMKTMNSKLIFVALQIADVVSTFACFHFGLYEVNPLTLYLIKLMGVFRGLLISKLLACAVILPMKRLVWVGNAFYILIVGWNLFLAAVYGLTKIGKVH